MGNAMNNVSAEGSANDTSGGGSGNDALGGSADTSFSAEAMAGMAVDASSEAIGFVEDVIGGGVEGTVGGSGLMVVDDFAIPATDSLNLADLVQDEYAEEGGSLASFLRFSFDPESNSTIINVSSTGNVSTDVDQQIVLSGVGDLTVGGNSDLSIIASLLSGQLLTDV